MPSRSVAPALMSKPLSMERGSTQRRADTLRYTRGLVRAAGGAIVFSLPLLMTTEMWQLGFLVTPGRMLLLLIALLPVLTLLSAHAGFEETSTWRQDVRDAVIAFGIAFASSAAVLWLFRVVGAHVPPSEMLGKIAIQTVPASIGAMLARSQLSDVHADTERTSPPPTYHGELFIMSVGALFLAFSVAPTDEVMHLALGMSATRTLIVVLVSLLLMHAFVYAVEFKGQHQRPEHVSAASEFVRLTVVGYVIALAVSAYLLWTFGTLDDLHPFVVLQACVVLGFPASVGAAAARLII
jgi:putative integral membrane protein (TIGR02587 family)